ncbi:MAG: lysozyme inhibitor LprI family protein [Pseudomonadota bacterium]
MRKRGLSMVNTEIFQGVIAYFSLSPFLRDRKKLYPAMAKIMMLIVALAIWPIPKAQAASFDCTKATTTVEKLVCSDAELSKLDEELATIYASALAATKYSDAVKKEQRIWLKARNNSCSENECLRTMYINRKNGLSTFLASMATISSTPAQAAFSTANSQIPEEVDRAQQQPSSKKYTYKLKEDTGWIVCKDLQKNLNLVRPSKASFNSEIVFHPSMKQFSHPEWQELKIEDYWQEVYTIESYLEYDRLLRLPLKPGLPSFDEWFQGYQEGLRRGFLPERLGRPETAWQRSLHPRLRMARVQFEKDGPLRTVLAYKRERHDIERWKENVDLYERCPVNQTCINKEDEGLNKRYYTKWGVYMEKPGDNIFFYDPKTRLLGDIGMVAWGCNSDKEANLFLHYGRAYLIALFDDEWHVRHIDEMSMKWILGKQQESGPDAYAKYTCNFHLVPENNQ